MSRKKPPAGLLERLPSLLTYPLRGSMPWMMAALSLLRMLNHLPSLLGLLFEVVFLVMAFKLAVEALTNTAHGRDEPLGASDLAATDGEAVRQLVLQILVIAALLVSVYFFGLPALVIGLAAIALLMPASVILLSMNGSLFNALNPVAWLTLIGRLGAGYFAAVAVVIALMVVSTIAEVALRDAFPADIGSLPATFVGLYSLIVVYHVLGDLIHRRSDALGLDVEPAIARATYANPLEDETMETAEACAADGRPGDAATLLQDLFRGRGASDPVHERFRDFVIADGDVARLIRHDREYVPSLVATGKDKRALAVYLDARTRDREFRIDHDETIARLVQQAMRGGQTRLGVELAQDFEERFPASELTPAVVLAVAWAMADQFDQVPQAILRLQRAMRAQPQHPLTEKLQALLLQIDKLPKVAS